MTEESNANAPPPPAVSTADPIDLRHLAAQSMNDRAIEAEVLDLFACQAGLLRAEIAGARGEERRRLAHTLKGSARGVGAFAVAVCAEAVEADPDDEALAPPLDARIGEALAWLAARGRS